MSDGVLVWSDRCGPATAIQLSRRERHIDRVDPGAHLEIMHAAAKNSWA